MHRLLGVAVQLVRVEIADVTLRYVQVCGLATLLVAEAHLAGCALVGQQR